MASKRNVRKKACVGKKPYTSQTEAVNAMRGMLATKAATPGTISSYKCQFCKKWHVGHNPAKYKNWLRRQEN